MNKYIRLDENSELPAVGSKVRIEDNAELIPPHNYGDIVTVVSSVARKNDKYIYVMNDEEMSENFIGGLYWPEELSLVVEE